MKHIPTWPLAALLILTPMVIVLLTQGSSRGFTPSEIPWCQMNEEDNVWEVHRIENFTVTSKTEEGCTYSDHYDGIVDYDDKGIAGTCPWRSRCGEFWKLKSATGTGQLPLAVLRYAKEMMEDNTYILGPEDGAKAGYGNFEDMVRTDTTLGIEATFEAWIGCHSIKGGMVSDKGTLCAGGSVFRPGYDYDFPRLLDVSCTCNGESTTFEGFSFCVDFACPDDTDPVNGSHICPNIDPEPIIDGDDEQVEQQGE